MKIFLGLLASGSLTYVGYFWVPYLMIFTIPAFAYFMWQALKEDLKQRDSVHEKISETHAILHRELLETHCSLIATIGDDENLKNTVLNLLIEAAKHLGDPHIDDDDDAMYGLEYFLNWNKAGLELVAQAKALLPTKP
ncbi:unnamed protein product [Sphagnum balticum]